LKHSDQPVVRVHHIEVDKRALLGGCRAYVVERFLYGLVRFEGNEIRSRMEHHRIIEVVYV
jgi:hypothetical protein